MHTHTNINSRLATIQPQSSASMATFKGTLFPGPLITRVLLLKPSSGRRSAHEAFPRRAWPGNSPCQIFSTLRQKQFFKNFFWPFFFSDLEIQTDWGAGDIDQSKLLVVLKPYVDATHAWHVRSIPWPRRRDKLSERREKESKHLGNESPPCGCVRVSQFFTQCYFPREVQFDRLKSPALLLLLLAVTMSRARRAVDDISAVGVGFSKHHFDFDARGAYT
jgi:hypothetical protein